MMRTGPAPGCPLLRALGLGLAATLAAACTSGDVGPPHADASVAGPMMQALSTPTDGVADFGIGLIAFREDWSLGERTDTLTLWSQPDGGFPVARFLWQLDSSGSWQYRVEQADGGAAVTAAFLEYGYEVAGLPVDSIDRSAAAARVIYGSDGDGAPSTAWVPLHPELLLISWRTFLPEQPLFFRDTRASQLFDSPEGNPIHFPLPEHDYQLEPDSADGPWLRVLVTTPHFCSGDPPARQTTAWIRYLDERARPTVWYYTRGC